MNLISAACQPCCPTWGNSLPNQFETVFIVVVDEDSVVGDSVDVVSVDFDVLDIGNSICTSDSRDRQRTGQGFEAFSFLHVF